MCIHLIVIILTGTFSCYCFDIYFIFRLSYGQISAKFKQHLHVQFKNNFIVDLYNSSKEI